MFQIDDRVRHKDEQKNEEYGLMIVYSISDTKAKCQSVDYSHLGVIEIPLDKLKMDNIQYPDL